MIRSRLARHARRWFLTVLLAPLLLGAMPLQAATAVAAEQALLGARDLLLDGQPAAAAERYRALLASTPDLEVKRQALEFLGVAQERAGDPVAAMASYREWLSLFGSPAQDTAAEQRVRQRLRAVLQQLSPTADRATTAVASRLQVDLSVAQEYWQEDFAVDDGIGDQSLSALVTSVNLRASYDGARADLLTRVDFAYQQPDGGDDAEPELWLSNGWLQLSSLPADLLVRVGRQHTPAVGVPGRYDGVSLSAPIGQRYRLGLVAGSPVDSPRYQADTRRAFVGFNGEVRLFQDELRLRPYLLLQSNDGQPDREAIGADGQWRLGALRLHGAVDYDLGYQTLNLGVVQANLRFSERLSVFARGQLAANPFLATTNAVIGQRTDGLDVLGNIYSDAQLRTLARARTVNRTDLSAGGSLVLSTRWYAAFGTTYTDQEASLAAGDIAATPAFNQFRSYLNLVGNSVLRQRDSVYLNYELNSTGRLNRHRVGFEWRVPLRPGWQLAPMLGVVHEDRATSAETNLHFEPGLRLRARFRERWQFDLLARRRTMDVQFDPGTDALDGTETSFQMALRMDL